ncbi:MAG: hypothetical protein JXJ04_13735 [Spirochaetales bacterium]|nr:hypothetical protein [Spirochaetales bacterium]
MTRKDQKLIALIREHRESILNSIDILKKSYDKCNSIELKPELTFEESESFDALTSKFARTSDLYTQGLLKTVPLLLRENVYTFIDRVNLGEKLGYVDNEDMIIRIRDLRNMIIHEYTKKDLHDIYGNVLGMTPALIGMIQNTIKSIDKYLTA